MASPRRSRFFLFANSWLARNARKTAQFIQGLPDALRKVKVPRPGSSFVMTASRSMRDASFERPTNFSMSEITTAYEVDSYVRQAVDKYVDLCFKEGWRLVGSNQAYIEYIRERFAYMEAISGRTIDEVLIQIVYNVVKYGNAFLAKARFPRRVALPFRAQGINGKMPVAFYEPLHPGTIEVARRENGEVVAFRQDVGGGAEPKIFAPDDIIHFPWKREDGNFFGTPWIAAAIEDVKLLRVIESGAENLIRKYVYPILHAKIGMPQPGYEAEDEDIEKAKADFESMPPEGVWVTPERYSLTAVGMDGEVLDISPYLRYMEQRVFTGLGVSETIMGRSGSAARTTALTQAREMYDRARAIHRIVEHIFNLHIIDELLLEGGFDPLENRSTKGAAIKFNEIDLDALFKRENNAIYKFVHNAITFPEMRAELGLDQDVDESQLYINMITLPRLMVRGGAGSVDDDTRDVDNRQQPANQYGKKTSADSDRQNEFAEAYQGRERITQKVQRLWDQMAELILRIAKSPHHRKEETARLFRNQVYLSIRSAARAIKHELEIAYMDGATKAREQIGTSDLRGLSVQPVVESIWHLAESDAERIAKDLSDRLEAISRRSPASLLYAQAKSAVEVTAYRLRFLAASYANLAYHAGFAYQAKAHGMPEVHVLHDQDACSKCRSIDRIDLSEIDLVHRIPPFHPGNCRCTLYLPKPQLHAGTSREEVS